MNERVRLACAVAALACVIAAKPIHARRAAVPALTARDILEARNRTRPRSEEYFGEITVIAKDGKERRKTWHSYRDGPAGASDQLIRFLSPPEVRGVGYLSRHRAGGEPDEWLYLPSMKRERRIGVRDRESAFIGTSFSYEDLDLLDVDPAAYDATLEPPETVGGVAVYAIDLVPRLQSAYIRKVLRIRQDTLHLLNAEFFVKDLATPAKRLTVDDYEEMDGYWVALRLEMIDVRKGSRTIVVRHDVKLDRPQPPGRYTLQNLLRANDEHEPSPVSSPAPAARPTRGWLAAPFAAAAQAVAPFRPPPAVAGFVEARLFAPWSTPAGASAPWQWATAFVQATPAWGPLRLDASVRLEESSTSQVGPPAFDPADRRPRRAPESIRTVAVTASLAPTLDLTAGRFDVAWGQTDGYSPADAFLPRDLSDPLTEERLPLWGADLRGEARGVRFEVLAVPILTPWRLVDFDGRHLQLPGTDVTLEDPPWDVPRRGFGAARVMGTAGGWDVSGWVRAGERPAPVLVPDIPADASAVPAVVVPLDRHFTTERAAGASISHPWGGWIVTGELGVSHSPDPAVKDAAIWTVGASREARNGLFTATIAGNALAPPSNPLLRFDAALLPLVILAVHQSEGWGSWHLVWLGTFHTVGGIFTGEVTRSLTDGVSLTAGADVPHGATLSPATAFTDGKRLRVAVRWSW